MLEMDRDEDKNTEMDVDDTTMSAMNVDIIKVDDVEEDEVDDKLHQYSMALSPL